MNNFEYCNPTRIEFGRGKIAVLKDLLPPDCKVMLVYGGGSILKNGVYNQVVSALKKVDFVEFSGIEANPKYETCMKAVEKVKANKVNFLLAVGGGSVLDATKFIAAASVWDASDDPWDILAKGYEINHALPLGDVITLPATGSEMNCNAVISRISTQEKLPFASEYVYPKFSIIDPEVTCSLSDVQTANGIVDTFIHVCEQAITTDIETMLQDYMAFGVLRTLIREGSLVLKDPFDYNVRANLFWSATIGLNGILGCGVEQDWSTHMIGHELTAIYGLDHARTLAVVMPALWRYKKVAKRNKLAKLAREVFKINELDDMEAADCAIRSTERFFHSLGVYTKLSDYGINAEEAALEVKRRFDERNVVFGEHHDINGDAAYKILLTC